MATVCITAIVGIVAIVAIVFGRSFNVELGSSRIRMAVRPTPEKVDNVH